MKSKKAQKESVAVAKKAIEAGKSFSKSVVMTLKISTAFTILGIGLVALVAKGAFLSLVQKKEKKHEK